MSNSSPASTLLGKIATYTEILSRDPKSTVFVPLADAYRSMGMLDDALDIALQGTLSQPLYPAGFLALGRIQVEKGHLGDARQSFEKALAIESENMEAINELVRTCRLLGEENLALRWQQKAASLVTEDEDVKGEEANRAAIEPSPVVSSGAAENAADRGVEPITTATIAEIYIRQGFLQRALKVYRDLLRADPQNTVVKQKLTDLQQRILETEGGTAGKAVLTPPLKDASLTHAVPPEVENLISPPSAEPSRRPDLLAVLNGWLESIHRRKMDVR
ncbi:MAG: tetratricopeptide repeat protein [Desulfuromonadales bacterium]